ncbi:MAG: phenylalanine--tRNA ligase alpha subunit [Candidatus Tyloplasma litorale]|nr:MAG: phenylalanine--tRNA ligase alpha subunit [Mycoplasmatales bacterium]
MLNEINQKIEDLKNEIQKVNDLEELKQIKAKYLSKSSFYNKLKNSIKIAENKKEIGQWIQTYTLGINSILNNKKEELENSFFLVSRDNPLFKSKKRINIEKKKGIIHPLTLVSIQVMEFFDKLNYHYAHSIELEEEKYNFDILNLGVDHPAREMQDTFYLSDGKLLRTHATNMSARELVNSKDDKYRSYSIGPVFRNDDNDATHSFQFSQIDIFNNGNNMNVSNLKWTLNELMKFIFEKNLDTRYRPSYFPFTEPSYEVDVQCPHCQGNKCRICSHTGWIEVLGSGMFSPIVFKNAGKNPDQSQGWAAGIGVERIAMMKWPITDIRDFYNNDINFLRNFKGEEN